MPQRVAAVFRRMPPDPATQDHDRLRTPGLLDIQRGRGIDERQQQERDRWCRQRQ